MNGLLIGLIAAAIGYFSGGSLQALHYMSLSWLCWYGLCQSITGTITAPVALGLVSVSNGSLAFSIIVNWLIRTGLLLGGAWLIYDSAINAASWDAIELLPIVGGFVMVLIGVLIEGSSSSSSSSSSRSRRSR